MKINSALQQRCNLGISWGQEEADNSPCAVQGECCKSSREAFSLVNPWGEESRAVLQGGKAKFFHWTRSDFCHPLFQDNTFWPCLSICFEKFLLYTRGKKKRPCPEWIIIVFNTVAKEFIPFPIRDKQCVTLRRFPSTNTLIIKNKQPIL